MKIFAAAALLMAITSIGMCADTSQGDKEPVAAYRQMWTRDSEGDETDLYIAFRGQFNVPTKTSIEVKTLGASWYVLWLDGKFLSEGPSRYPVSHPEYQSDSAKIGPGAHTLAAVVHSEGVETRMLKTIPPFLICQVQASGKELPIAWRCRPMQGFERRVKRLNPQFGWIEWRDMRAFPANWRDAGYDDSGWHEPITVDRGLGEIKPLSSANVRYFFHHPVPIAQGLLQETYGYETDNIAARFFLRDLKPKPVMAQGVWRRYDLGRVRLMRPRFTLDLPEGSVVEFAYSESLVSGRVSPWITLSAGDSCNMDHYVARGGRQEFFPITPRGGRFVEAHIIFPDGRKPGDISKYFVGEEFVERCYYDKPEGSFRSGDKLLDRIWAVGIETHRACSEDALIDNPTRERGQWAGDVVSVGMDIAAVGYSDLRLCRRALIQCAQCARGDGLICGLCPGGEAFLSTYSAQWLSACVHYWELTGDKSLLEELCPAAERNVEAFEKATNDDGVSDSLGWAFVDWGYIRNPGPSDIALDLHYLAGLRDMARWCKASSKLDREEYYTSLADKLQHIIERWFAAQIKDGKPDWDAIGYHRAVLGLRLGFLKDHTKDGVAYIKRHMLSCFPNDPDAPKLSSPSVNNPRLITPYFAHYAMPLLIENGEMDFVLGQYRKCWGWALEDGRTTWLEVFDTRWSHCHQWAGAPTWQLSRYVLGLTPRYDLGDRHYVLDIHTGSLKQAKGALPIPDGKGVVSIEWRRGQDGIHYTLKTPEPIYLHTNPADLGSVTTVEGNYSRILAL